MDQSARGSMTDVPLLLAGALAVVAAVIHGGAGEVLVVSRLSADVLPPTRFGGPRTTQAMVHVTWHITTVAFLAVGASLLLSGSVLEGDAARAVALVAAGASTAFAAVAVAIGAWHARSVRSLLAHPGPALLTATAALAWWGAL
jgi:hypothetical protein